MMNLPNAPATLATTKTTLPILSQVALSASLAVMAIIAVKPIAPKIYLGFFNTTITAVILVLIAVIALWCSSLACLISHRWNPDEIPRFLFTLKHVNPLVLNQHLRSRESETNEVMVYLAKCYNKVRLWYKYAVWLYNLGSVSFFVGVIIYILPIL